MLNQYVLCCLFIGKELTGATDAATIPEVINIAITGYGLKFAIGLALTPLLYVLKSILTDKFGLVPIPVQDSDEGNK